MKMAPLTLVVGEHEQPDVAPHRLRHVAVATVNDNVGSLSPEGHVRPPSEKSPPLLLGSKRRASSRLGEPPSGLVPPWEEVTRNHQRDSDDLNNRRCQPRLHDRCLYRPTQAEHGIEEEK